MKKYVQQSMTAWEDFPELKALTDQDIKDILNNKDTPSSDAARKAILRIYSYETPLYSALNNANQCQDQGAIKTLGPFAHLIRYICLNPGKANKKVQEEAADREEEG